MTNNRHHTSAQTAFIKGLLFVGRKGTRLIVISQFPFKAAGIIKAICLLCPLVELKCTNAVFEFTKVTRLTRVMHEMERKREPRVLKVT